ncbi:MAG: glycosyltransferase [Nitrososphaerota archaeon]|nr:glycosyltransferase [Nitrososphaerota archaeon]MDG7014919.1 glycosyltransferase [Nitrososphaerota archaeon]WGO50879.1 MAG: glycosyltransferase [Nitrososphaerota archaeon]
MKVKGLRILVIDDLGIGGSIQTYAKITKIVLITKRAELLKLQSPGVAVHRIPSRRFVEKFELPSVLDFVSYFASATAISIIAATKYRVKKIVGVYSFPQGLVAMLVGALTKNEVLIDTDGGDIDLLLRNRFIRATLRAFTKRTTTILALNPSKAKAIKRLLGHDAHVLSTIGVDAERFPFVPFRSKSKWKAICVSRFSPEKGLFVLLNAVKGLAPLARQSNIELSLIGYGPEESRIREYIRFNAIEDIVRVVGPVDHDSISTQYSEAAIFILPSYREGLSVALLEAMSSGCLCVVSDIPSNMYVISPGSNAITFRSGDHVDLTKRLNWIFSHQSEVALISKNASQHVAENFSREKAIRDLAKLLSQSPSISK